MATTLAEFQALRARHIPKSISHSTPGLIREGRSGPYAPEIFQKLQAICRRHGIVLNIDEIQSGMGRTGKRYAIEHRGVEPDLIITDDRLERGFDILEQALGVITAQGRGV